MAITWFKVILSALAVYALMYLFLFKEPKMSLYETCKNNACASIWDDVETEIKFKLPTYLKNLLVLYGFDNWNSIFKFCEDDIAEIEEFARTVLPKMCSGSDKIEYYGIFSNNIEDFRVIGGHKKLLLKVVEHFKNQ